MRRLLVLLLAASLLIPTVLADDDDDDDDDDEGGLWGGEMGEDLGDLSMWLLIGTIALVGWKPLHIWLRKSGLEKMGVADVKAAKKQLTVVNRWMMKIHLWIGVAAVLVGAVHGLGSTSIDLESSVAWFGWGGMLLMSILGGLMMWKWPPRKVKKGARVLHTQRAVLVVTILLLVAGHELM